MCPREPALQSRRALKARTWPGSREHQEFILLAARRLQPTVTVAAWLVLSQALVSVVGCRRSFSPRLCQGYHLPALWSSSLLSI